MGVSKRQNRDTGDFVKYRKKPVIVEATRWFRNGDHPNDETEWVQPSVGHGFESEGRVVRYYNQPSGNGLKHCEHCGNIMRLHGWVDTLESGHIVCPGDWVITGVKGEYYPCKPDIFEATYEAVDTL